MNDEKRAANVAHNGFVKFFLLLSLIWSTLLLSSRTLLVLQTFLLLSGFTILISKNLCGLSFIIHYNNVKLNEQWVSISWIGLMERSFFSVRSLSRKRGTSTEVKKLKGSYVKVVVWFRDGIIYYNHSSNWTTADLHSIYQNNTAEENSQLTRFYRFEMVLSLTFTRHTRELRWAKKNNDLQKYFVCSLQYFTLGRCLIKRW